MADNKPILISEKEQVTELLCDIMTNRHSVGTIAVKNDVVNDTPITVFTIIMQGHAEVEG